MKRNKIFKNSLVVVAALLVGAMTTACSEWDDHYDGNGATEASAQSTLWENIASNSQLSQFATLLSKSGYDKVLSASQTYTVWAPLNDTFDYNTLAQVGNEKLLKEFVQNHVARNNYAASGTLNEKIVMLNEKVHSFTGAAGSYLMGSVATARVNLPSSNGLIHTLQGKIDFRANIYESLEAKDFPIDSISDYFHSFDQKVLDLQKSIEGPIKDGAITYLDSVFEESNSRYNLYGAYINSEDSNYTMIVPTNEAWTKAKKAVEPYFNYIPSFTYRENAGGSNVIESAIEISDVDYLRDSVINLSLMRGLFYNNNLYNNGALNNLQAGQRLQVDSLVTTSYLRSSSTGPQKLYSTDAAGLFEGTTRVDKSNGAIFVTDDSLRMHPWSFVAPLIKVEAEAATNVPSTRNANQSVINIVSGGQNPEIPGYVSNNSYLELANSSPNSNPEACFYLRNVLSTTYSVYVVVVPPTITNPNAVQKPSAFQARLYYNRDTGSFSPIPFTFGGTGNIFTTDSSKIDTVYLGDFTFPIAYAHVPDSPAPYLQIQGLVGRASTPAENYDRVLRIDCLLLVPKELDEYMKEHPDYVYPTYY